jgi:hypothetical protein
VAAAAMATARRSGGALRRFLGPLSAHRATPYMPPALSVSGGCRGCVDRAPPPSRGQGCTHRHAASFRTAASAAKAAPSPATDGGVGTKLVVVESPSKAVTIQKYLGRGYVVLASCGHVRDLVSKSGRGLYSFTFQLNLSCV